MTQKEISEVLADTPTSIGHVKLPRWGWIGRRLGLRKRVELTIQGQPNIKVEMIGTELSEMLGAEDIEKLNQSDQINALLKNNIRPIVRIIGMACMKEDKMPSKDLLRAIGSTFTMTQLETAFMEVYRRLDLKPFFGIMGFAKSLSLNLFQDQEVHSQE
ncbi:hypothetical protein [Sphingobacterium kyonggiense]